MLMNDIYFKTCLICWSVSQIKINLNIFIYKGFIFSFISIPLSYLTLFFITTDHLIYTYLIRLSIHDIFVLKYRYIVNEYEIMTQLWSGKCTDPRV